MKKEYDFSKAEQGKFYRPIEELKIPVYLDKEAANFPVLRESFPKHVRSTKMQSPFYIDENARLVYSLLMEMGWNCNAQYCKEVRY